LSELGLGFGNDLKCERSFVRKTAMYRNRNTRSFCLRPEASATWFEESEKFFLLDIFFEKHPALMVEGGQFESF
jgi:hypothetical protein